MKLQKRYIILDRDGVINYESDQYIKSIAEWKPLPGSLEAIAQLHRGGFKIGIATNQSGIARGLYDETSLDSIHHHLSQCVQQQGGSIDIIRYCPHGPADQCSCRKPQPGLLLEIARFWQIELSNVYFVGDSLRDLQAAKAAGAQAILVRTGYGHRTLTENPQLTVPVYDDLLCFVQNYLEKGDLPI